MKRTILSVAYPLTTVGTDAVGGSEQILAALDRALTSAGHHSIVLAAEGTRIQGTLVPSPAAPAYLNDSVREWGRQVHRKLIAQTLATYPVDLVHFHSLDFHHYVPAGRVPILATLHLPPDWYPRRIFSGRARYLMNCVSPSQHRACPPSSRLLDPIPNGVDIDKLDCNSPKDNFALALGRICPEKGFHFALDAARMAGAKLLLAGEIFPYDSHLSYFREQIEPRLDRDRRFLGPARFTAKRRLLSQAKCLIVSSTVAETSSLVAMEALACGTPVIAFRSGALPDIIDHGVTGFIVSDTAEMSCAIEKIDSIDPEVCRQTARARFSAQTMQENYLSLYQRVIERQLSQTSFASSCRVSEWAAA